MSSLILRQALNEIVKGYSECSVKKNRAFIKHFSIFDQSEIETLKEELYEKARLRGLPTEEESLFYLKDNEIWTHKDESDLLQSKNFIETLEKTKSNKFLLSEIRHLNEQIKIEKEKYAEKLYKKRELLGQTCETYSENRVSEYYILQSFYRDPQLKERYFSMDEIDELDRRDLVYIINIYNESYKKFEDINIQKIVVSDFFTMYVPFCDDVRNFFDKPLFGLSINQVKIITYAKMFKNIFERYSDMPDSVRNDPEKIMEYVNSKERSKDALSNVDKSGASTIVGAKSEDYKNLGIQTKNSKSLSDMLKQNGGKMNMEDLANLMS